MTLIRLIALGAAFFFALPGRREGLAGRGAGGPAASGDRPVLYR